jgi:3-deoxy-D-manno-octulosonate 8-phosphate phosphatase KdsC-like HAD superfamily phosphatase
MMGRRAESLEVDLLIAGLRSKKSHTKELAKND